MIVSFACNLAVGIPGVLQFGSASSQNILLDYPADDGPTLAMSVLMATTTCVCIPMNVYPLRTLVHQTFAGGAPQTRALFLLETTAILLLAYGTSVAVPHIGVIFDVTGATGCMLVSYTLPCAFVLAVGDRRCCGAVVVVGLVGTASCLVSLGVVLPELGRAF